FALAPDGRTAVYVTQDKGAIVLQDLDGGGSQAVYAAPKGSYIERADWSAEGSRILFGVVGTGLKVMSIPRLGGEARLEMNLGHLLNLNGLQIFPAGRGEWIVASDRRMYVGPDPASLRIEAGYLAGSTVFPTPGALGVGNFFAVASPDGDWIGYSSNDSTFTLGTSIVSRDGKAGPGRVAEWSGLEVCGWTADGSAVYLLRSAGDAFDLLRAPIDRRTGRPRGSPVLVYPRLQDATGVRISRDGRRLVVVSGSTSTRIRVFDLDRTPDPSDNHEASLSQGTAIWRAPAFLRDGRIAVFAPVPGGYDLLALSRAGHPPQLLGQRRDRGLPLQYLNPSPDGQTFALIERDRERGLAAEVTLLDTRGGRAQAIPLPERASGTAWSPDGRHLGAMTASSPDRAMTVDVGAGTARSVKLQCGDRCEFAYETIAMGPEWPFAAASSQNDVWTLNLETGAVRLLAADAWEAIAWLGDWVYFIRRVGQTDQRRRALFRVQASGGREERLINLPPECEDNFVATVSPDGKSVACAELTVRQDIRVIDDFDPAAGNR
ncbi:MAG: hypothetical protein OEV95_09700, partial [Gemmatimonadota bacterium]|nr:hypothetical protein [Gemmatimonadota bacterium]